MPALLLRFAPHLGLAALLALAGLALALRVQSGRLGDASEALALEKALHETSIANFRAAQARADADWQAEIARRAAHSRRQKDDADQQADAARTLYLDRVLRLPAAAADPGPATATGLPGTGAAASPDRSGRDAVLLARSDALICAANTARLIAAHGWALDVANDAGGRRDPSPRP
jgi:hypothetical protein